MFDTKAQKRPMGTLKKRFFLMKTKMWDVFPDDMGLDSSVELALANLDLNELVLEPVTFDDDDHLEGHPPHQWDADLGLNMEEDEEEDGGKSSGSGGDFDDSDIEEDH
jgi:hypothetical protein